MPRKRPPFPKTSPVSLPDDIWRQLVIDGIPAFPADAADTCLAALVAESGRSFNEVSQPSAQPTVNGPNALQGLAVAVIGAELDHAVAPNTPQRYGSYFNIPVYMLGADWGLGGHGHMWPIEFGNDLAFAHIMDLLHGWGIAG
jgi:hypothetical protein